MGTILGDKIKKIRESKDLTQEMLAEQAHLSWSFISRIERGKSHPRPASLKRIADALGVQVGDFYDELVTAESDATSKAIVHAIGQMSEKQKKFILLVANGLLKQRLE